MIVGLTLFFYRLCRISPGEHHLMGGWFQSLPFQYTLLYKSTVIARCSEQGISRIGFFKPAQSIGYISGFMTYRIAFLHIRSPYVITMVHTKGFKYLFRNDFLQRFAG